MTEPRRMFFALLIVICAAPGCGGMSNEQRLKKLVPNAERTFPVQGQVLVDGKPVKDILVRLHPPDATAQTLIPEGITNGEGIFHVRSYIGGDGAARRKYKITVEWLTHQELGNRWIGPNKLLDKYGDIAATPYEVNVVDKPVVLPPFKVESKAGPPPAPTTSAAK